MKSIHIIATLIVATLAVSFGGQSYAQKKKTDATYNRKNEMCRVRKRNAIVLVENEM